MTKSDTIEIVPYSKEWPAQIQQVKSLLSRSLLSFRSNIHVRKFGLKNRRYPLLFRNYLREHPQVSGVICARQGKASALSVW